MELAPAVGFEPTTKRLTAARSTTELRRSEGAAEGYGDCGDGRIDAPGVRIARAARPTARV